MANPTTNFGWVMPTTTDLVTDLPADFDVFGQGVDTSLKALNPETTLGDIAYRSSTANTNTRLAIGSSGQVLTVSGGVPAWATPSPTFVGCSLSKSTGQSISSSTYTAITFDQEAFDTDSFHSTSSNTSRITIPSGKAGKYLFTSQIYWGVNVGNGNYAILKLYKNGVAVTNYGNSADTSSAQRLTTNQTVILDLAVNDYIEMYGYTNNGTSVTISEDGTFLQCQYLGA